MASQSVSILLDVTSDDNGFDVTMSPDSATTLPPLANVNANTIQLGASTEEEEYTLEFSILTSGFLFDDTNPILWPYPPGTEFPILYSFGHADPGIAATQCSIRVTVSPFADVEPHSFLFFFNLVLDSESPLASEINIHNNRRIRVLADPTIVTDPDPDM